MAPRIFLTGASGYVGGQFIPNMRAKHPSYQIISLVRTKETGEKLTSKYPSVQIVIGDLDSSSLLVEQSKLADVVIRIYARCFIQCPLYSKVMYVRNG